MCVITAALKVCPWNSHACAFKFLSEIRLQSQNWTQPLKMTSWGALPATGDVKTKCQQSFQAFLGNEMTFKGARLGLPFGWQTCLIIMFPCGRLLCNSLDTHSGQLRAVWGQQESITINRPFGVKRRWSDDLTDDSCWLCLPEGPLIKNSAEDLHNTVTVPLQSERGCAVLPSICFFPTREFWTFSLNLLLCLHEIIAAFLVAMSFCLRSLMRCHPPWERDVILLGRGKLRTPHPPLRNCPTKQQNLPMVLSRHRAVVWCPVGKLVV